MSDLSKSYRSQSIHCPFRKQGLHNSRLKVFSADSNRAWPLTGSISAHSFTALDTLEHWQSMLWATSRARTIEVSVWSTSQRPAQGHHPLSQCLPLTQQVLCLSHHRAPLSALGIHISSLTSLSPRNSHSQSNISCHVPPASLAQTSHFFAGCSLDL